MQCACRPHHYCYVSSYTDTKVSGFFLKDAMKELSRHIRCSKYKPCEKGAREVGEYHCANIITNSSEKEG